MKSPAVKGSTIKIPFISLGDGCIFVWRLPPEMTSTMLARLHSEATGQVSKAYISHEQPPVEASSFSPSPTPEMVLDPNGVQGPPGGADYRFSIGKLPSWAKKQVQEGKAANGKPAGDAAGGPDFPKGRWADRVGAGVTVKSHHEADSVIPFPAPKFDSDSKESSLEPQSNQQSPGPERVRVFKA